MKRHLENIKNAATSGYLESLCVSGTRTDRQNRYQGRKWVRALVQKFGGFARTYVGLSVCLSVCPHEHCGTYCCNFAAS